MEKEVRKYKKHKKGYTISVTYFLKQEKGVFEGVFDRRARDPQKFPLHVRVAFLGQNVRIKSRIDAYISESDYDNFINSPDIEQLIRHETESIKYSVKLFEPDSKDNFLISSWATLYKKWNETLDNCLREATAYRLMTGLQQEFQIPDTDAMEAILRVSTAVYESIEYYVYLRSNTAMRLQENIRYIIEIPKTYVVTFASQTITFRYTYWDWKAGSYTQAFKEVIDISTVTQIEELMSDYEHLKLLEEKNR